MVGYWCFSKAVTEVGTLRSLECWILTVTVREQFCKRIVLLQRQKLSHAQLWVPLLLCKQNCNWMQNTGVWFLWSSPEFPLQRWGSPEIASLRSDGILTLNCLTECLSALPCDKSFPGTAVHTSLWPVQSELAKGVLVILALTSLS